MYKKNLKHSSVIQFQNIFQSDKIYNKRVLGDFFMIEKPDNQQPNRVFFNLNKIIFVYHLKNLRRFSYISSKEKIFTQLQKYF